MVNKKKINLIKYKFYFGAAQVFGHCLAPHMADGQVK